MGNFPQTRGAAMLLSRSLQAGSSKLVLRSLAGNGRGISTSRVALPSSLVNPEHSDDVDRSVVEDDELGGGGGEVIEDLGAVGRLHSVCLPTVFLPPEMQEAVDTVLSGQFRKTSAKDGEHILKYLKNRTPPDCEWTKTRQNHKDSKDSNGNENTSGKKMAKPWIVKPIRAITSGDSRGGKSSKWSPGLSYRKRESLAFLAGRAQASYGTALRALSEIAKRDKSYSPRTLLDFGSGLGTVECKKQKTTKNMRNEAGKALMEERCSFGIETGEYQGTGVGKSGANGREVEPVDNATDEEEDQILEQIEIPSTAPLLVFFDIETTGLDIYNDTIIDIAAKVVGATVSQRTYQSLVRTSKTIPERVIKLTGIHDTDLLGERPLSVVLKEFFTWVETVVNEQSGRTGKDHHPVLVAHNGIKFDFPLLLAEIDRRKESISSSVITEYNVHFADTLQLLWKAKKDGYEALKEVTKFSLTNLYEQFLPGQEFNAHRALPDVEAMEALFMARELLHDLLPSLVVRTPQQQLHHWTRQKLVRSRVQHLVRVFGNKITTEHAKQLMNLNVTLETLQKWKSESRDKQHFVDTLKKEKVNSKILREQLSLFFFK